MRKILGILLVLGSSTAMGLDCLRKKRLRIRKLKEMAAMLDEMEREIRERRTPLSRLMQKLAVGQGGGKKTQRGTNPNPFKPRKKKGGGPPPFG